LQDEAVYVVPEQLDKAPLLHVQVCVSLWHAAGALTLAAANISRVRVEPRNLKWSVPNVTFDVSQHNTWLNALLDLNMSFITVTSAVFHAPIGWLNGVASNMPFISVT